MLGQKIADATKIPLDYLQKLSYAQLEGFFDQIDTDMSAIALFIGPVMQSMNPCLYFLQH